MAKKIKEKPSLDSLILGGDKIKKINLYLKEYLTAEIKLKNSSFKIYYINIDKQDLNKLLDFYNKYKKMISNSNNSPEIPRKKDILVRMILEGYEIERIKTYNIKLDSVITIHFKNSGSFIYRHMNPKSLGKYMLDYWKSQGMNNDADELINTTLVNKGPEKKPFQNYKKEVIKSFYEFLGLPDNYSNKNKD